MIFMMKIKAKVSFGEPQKRSVHPLIKREYYKRTFIGCYVMLKVVFKYSLIKSN